MSFIKKLKQNYNQSCLDGFNSFQALELKENFEKTFYFEKDLITASPENISTFNNSLENLFNNSNTHDQIDYENNTITLIAN